MLNNYRQEKAILNTDIMYKRIFLGSKSSSFSFVSNNHSTRKMLTFDMLIWLLTIKVSCCLKSSLSKQSKPSIDLLVCSSSYNYVIVFSWAGLVVTISCLEYFQKPKIDSIKKWNIYIEGNCEKRDPMKIIDKGGPGKNTFPLNEVGKPIAITA